MGKYLIDFFRPRVSQQDRIEHLLEEILSSLDQMENTLMTLLSEVKESMAAALAASAANTDATASIGLAVSGLKAAVLTANQALADHIANHPADTDLAEIKAAFDAIASGANADTIAEQALANTEADPAPGG